LDRRSVPGAEDAMKLTLYTDYGLRVLLYLGLQERATVTEIANAYQIARPHVVKVVHHLGRLGLIGTQRGRGGGIWLAKRPDEINLGTVVRALEPDFHIVGCFGGSDGGCVISPVCSLKGVLGLALSSFFEVLDRHSLADLVDDREALRTRLQV
jgi:Rrf2 family transcriptional regulator, nitric oxide-sensitive transcriptional repressor